MSPVHLSILPDAPRGSLKSDGSRERIVTADVRGRFHRARTAVFAGLLLVPLALPWVTVGGRPAVWLDVPRRRFFVLGGTFNAQDTWLLLFVLLATALALMATTVIAGRVLCGWFCPQTVLLDAIIRPIERLVHGSRDLHLRRERRAPVWERALRKGAELAAYACVSIVLAHLIAALFVTPDKLSLMVREGPAASPVAFRWVAGISIAIMLDASWFREQLCLIVCPYGRLQSLLLDAHSLVVGYDRRRGEPRGKASTTGAGACVDCGRCVAVCPTGIDIRNGLQVDCVACTACIDACDEIMDKLERPRGLIRYDSQNGFAGMPTRLTRPRTLVYTAVAAAAAIAATVAIVVHDDFEARLARLPGSPYVVEEGRVRNSFEVLLVNKRPEAANYVLEPKGPEGIELVLAMREVRVEPLAQLHIPMFAAEPAAGFHGRFDISVGVRRVGDDGGGTRWLSAAFLGPAN